jgi:hypothetical protein
VNAGQQAYLKMWRQQPGCAVDVGNEWFERSTHAEYECVCNSATAWSLLYLRRLRRRGLYDEEC